MFNTLRGLYQGSSIQRQLSQLVATNPSLYSRGNLSTVGKIAGGMTVFGTLLSFRNSDINNDLNLLTSTFNGALRSEYISSSSLGIQSEKDLIGRVYDPRVGDLIGDRNSSESRKLKEITSSGTESHEHIARALIRSGHATSSEYYVEDTKNKVFGTIDVMLNGGIPLEIKTVSSKELRTLKAPKLEHISQANFYALAMNQPYAYIQYYSREDSQAPKSFTITADPSLYMNDIMRIRSVQSKYKGASSSSPYMSGFRPMSSWFGGGVNHNMPTAKMSKVEDQKARLSRLPVSMNMPQSQNVQHSNFSRAGF